eukprot:TRINITY_DN1240_c0_g1_i2.p1 TRINITY_DN1240_c0_g1~~TRINITY_DN1240_c0_g1_i2.p1  ORF type:complete len:683 (-),score=97.03 TRINITY_DN1240_c0_g1_i2:19-1845(-)
MQNVKLTHALLSDYLTVDPFDKMLKEINQDVSIGQFRGRIIWHVFSELISDILPNFIYNSNTQRFVRGPQAFAEDAVRERPPSNVQPWFWYGMGFKEAFEREAAICRGYFGVEHMEALLSVLAYPDIPLIIHEAITDISNKTIYDFSPYAKVLSSAIPPMKLPPLFYGVVGGYGYFDIKLAQIGKYSALRSGVFQLLREIGNTMLFVRLLETVIKKMEDFNFGSLAFFAGIQPIPPKKNVPPGTPPDIRDVPFVIPTGPSPVSTIIQGTVNLLASKGDKEMSLLNHLNKAAVSAPALYPFDPENMSMLTASLQRLTHILQEAKIKEEWKGNPPAGEDIINVEHPGDIIRLWSCLLFLFCRPPDKPGPDGQIVDDQVVFGEGILWAGCLLIHLMGYKSRFEFLDFSYHILKLAALKPLPAEVDPTKEKKSKKKVEVNPSDAMIPSARAFLRNVVQVKSTSETIYSCLETYLPSPTATPFQLRPPDKDVDAFTPVRRMSLNPLPGETKEMARASTGLLTTPSKSTIQQASSSQLLSPSQAEYSQVGEDVPVAPEWGGEDPEGYGGSDYVNVEGGEGEGGGSDPGSQSEYEEIGRAVQQECRDRSRMPSSA